MIVKNLSFGDDAKYKVFKGIETLSRAVSSTLGASGQCVLLEDSNGFPIIFISNFRNNYCAVFFSNI